MTRYGPDCCPGTVFFLQVLQLHCTYCSALGGRQVAYLQSPLAIAAGNINADTCFDNGCGRS